MLRLIKVLALALVVVISSVPARADQTDLEVFSTTIRNINNTNNTTIPNVPVGGLNKVLVVTISLANGGTTVTSCTYDPGPGAPVALTRRIFQNSSGNNVRTEIWTLMNPVDSANGTVAITTGAGTDIVAAAVVVNNVNQTTPVVSATSALANNADPCQVAGIASVARQLIVGCAAVNNNATTSTPLLSGGNPNMTELYDQQTGGGSGGGTIEAMGGIQAGNITTFGWDLNANRNWSIAVIVLQGPAGAPTMVRYKTATAAVLDDHVRISWATGMERENLGFRVFREDAGGRTQVTPELIAGSGLMVSAKRTVRGRTYSVVDPGPVDLAARYFIEDVDRHGVKTWYGPIPVSTDPAAVAAVIATERGESLRRASRTRQPKRKGGPLGIAPAASAEAMQLGTFSANATRATNRERNTQRGLAGRPAVKIAVNGPGWYRVDQAQLAAAGLPADVDAKSLSLHADGREVAITLRQARAARFTAGDAIEFFGVGQDTLTTDRRVYWLTWGNARGDRVVRANAPGVGAGAASFPFAVERRDRTLYDGTLNNGDADNFLGAFLADGAVDQTLELPHPHAAGAPARLVIALRGYSENHGVAVAFNGNPLGVMTWSGNERHEQVFSVPMAHFVDGTNTVRLTPSPGEDFSAVEFIRVEYPHTYQLDGDAVLCTAAGGAPQTIRGFSNNGARVVDVTDPERARELVGRVAADGGAFAVTVTPPGSGPRTLIAFTDTRATAPLAVEANVPSSWSAASNQGAVVYLTHPSFAAALEPLRARRAAQAGTAVVVDVTDVYDEFSFGVKDTQAIRDFVDAAASWTTPPGHVVLVGDATSNPRNFEQEFFEGTPDLDFVPTKMVNTTEFEAASDDWYTDRDGDGAADVAIGRIPVKSAAEVTALVDRLVAYETQGPDPSWSRKAVVVADAFDGETDFEVAAGQLTGALPGDFTSEVLSIGTAGSGAVRDGLQAALGGAGVIAFFGHGSFDFWSGGAVLTPNDLSSGAYAPRFPVIMAMTCLNGSFHDYYGESFAEPALRAAGGPVALLAASGFCHPGSQPVLAAGFASQVAAGATFGQALVAAKKAVGDPDVRATFHLFGDPSMRLR